MGKAEVLSLVQTLAVRADSASISQYYDEILFELGRANQTVQVALVETTAETATYNAPDDTIEILSVLYDDMQLYEAGIRDIEAHSTAWRDEVGIPSDYVTEFETDNAFRLYPAPEAPGKPFIWTGAPFGWDFPEYAATIIYQQKKDDLAEYFDLYLAMAVIEREFSRESDHRDLPLAKLCGQLAALFLRMVL